MAIVIVQLVGNVIEFYLILHYEVATVLSPF